MKVGDGVRIREDSCYLSQCKEIGKITDKIIDVTGIWFVVKFVNGYENDYREEDLEIADENVIVKLRRYRGSV